MELHGKVMYTRAQGIQGRAELFFVAVCCSGFVGKGFRQIPELSSLVFVFIIFGQYPRPIPLARSLQHFG